MPVVSKRRRSERPEGSETPLVIDFLAGLRVMARQKPSVEECVEMVAVHNLRRVIR